MGGRLRRGLGGDVGGDIVRMCRKTSRTYGSRRGACGSGGSVGGGRSRAAFELGGARVDRVRVQCASQHLVAVDLFRRPVVEDDRAHVKLVKQLPPLNVATGRVSMKGIGGKTTQIKRRKRWGRKQKAK